jgi:hypothetical protein
MAKIDKPSIRLPIDPVRTRNRPAMPRPAKLAIVTSRFSRQDISATMTTGSAESMERTGDRLGPGWIDAIAEKQAAKVIHMAFVEARPR